MSIAIISIIVIVILWLILYSPPCEYFSSALRFASIPSGSPVPYGQGPITHGNGHHIRRWRTAIPTDGTGAPVFIGAPNWTESNAGLAAMIPKVEVVPRSIPDDTWARTYDSGIGFQLG